MDDQETPAAHSASCVLYAAPQGVLTVSKES